MSGTEELMPIVMTKPKRGQEIASTPINEELYHEGYIDGKKYYIPDSNLEAMKDTINIKMRPRKSTRYKHQTSYELPDYDHFKQKIEKLLTKIDEVSTSSSENQEFTDKESRDKLSIDNKEEREKKKNNESFENEIEGSDKSESENVEGEKYEISESEGDDDIKHCDGDKSKNKPSEDVDICNEMDESDQHNRKSYENEDIEENNTQNRDLDKVFHKIKDVEEGTFEVEDNNVKYHKFNDSEKDKFEIKESRNDFIDNGNKSKSKHSENEDIEKENSQGSDSEDDKIEGEGENFEINESEGNNNNTDYFQNDNYKTKYPESKQTNSVTSKNDDDTIEKVESKPLVETIIDFESNTGIDKEPIQEIIGQEKETPSSNVQRFRFLISGHFQKGSQPIYIIQEYEGGGNIFEDQKADFVSRKNEDGTDILISGKFYKENILNKSENKPAFLNIKPNKIEINFKTSKIFHNIFEETVSMPSINLVINGKFIKKDDTITPFFGFKFEPKYSETSKKNGNSENEQSNTISYNTELQSNDPFSQHFIQPFRIQQSTNLLDPSTSTNELNQHSKRQHTKKNAKRILDNS